jgi:hypothetical protein
MYMYVDADGWLTWESEVNATITNGDVILHQEFQEVPIN